MLERIQDRKVKQFSPVWRNDLDMTQSLEQAINKINDECEFYSFDEIIKWDPDQFQGCMFRVG